MIFQIIYGKFLAQIQQKATLDIILCNEGPNYLSTAGALADSTLLADIFQTLVLTASELIFY